MSLRVKKSRLKSKRKSASATPKRHVRQKITINLDTDIIEFFKAQAEKEGAPYQFLINQILREYVRGNRVDQLTKAVSEQLLNDQSFLQRLIQSASNREEPNLEDV